jgi:peptidoglycan-associated lipoprotein
MHPKILSLLAAASLLAGCAALGPQDWCCNDGSGGVTRGTPDQELKLQVGDRIFFDLNKSSISTTARGTLERQATFVKTYPQLAFTVAGNCDDRGTREYNLALGERRAAADKAALVALGVEDKRVKTISYGKERPAVVGENEAAWAQNRNAITTID